MTKLRIAEIYGLVVQGEGPMIGAPTVFVRSGGCDYRCSWCDTLHAVLPEHRFEWESMEPAEVLDAVREISPLPCLVTLSGGNPCTQAFGPLIDLGHEAGYRFSCETQGSVAPAWLNRLDHLVLSPKGPSSGMETDWDRLKECTDLAFWGHVPACLKIVIFNEADYDFAKEAAIRFHQLPMFLQVGNARPPNADGSDPGFDVAANLSALRTLMDRVCSDRWTSARVLPQLHLLAHGNERFT